MNESERKALIEKILNVNRDVKGSRVATTVFIKRATKDEAKFFLKYLDNSDSLIKRIARHIVGHMGIVEALDIIEDEFNQATEGMTFLPDEEIKEEVYFANLIEIVETIFLICKSENIKNDDLLHQIDEILKKTKNEDLRFSLIKLLGILGDRIDFFLRIYPEFTTKEKRALYYIYSFVEDPKRGEIFRRGLSDKANFEFVVSNALMTEEGKALINSELPGLSNSDKQFVLTKMLEGKFPEFQETLIDLLNSDNKYIIELAADNLKQSMKLPFPLAKFQELINNGYTPELIKSSLALINRYVKKNIEEIYFEGLNTQKLYANKIIIIETLFNKLKSEKKITEAFSKKILQLLLEYFKNYNNKKDEFLISALKIIAYLKFSKSLIYKTIKKELLQFHHQYDTQFSNVMRNNLKESITRINSSIEHVEQSEEQLKGITVLFDLNPDSIEVERFDKLKRQLEEIKFIDDAFLNQLENFLMKVHDASAEDWKKRAATLKLLGAYGTPKILPKIVPIAKNEKSLGVRVSAEDAVGNIKTRHGVGECSVLLLVPPFYINKLLTDFFTAQSFKIVDVKDADKLAEHSNQTHKFAFISDNFIKTGEMQPILDMLPETDTTVFIITPTPDEFTGKFDHPNLKFLKKPFKNDQLAAIIKDC